MSRYIDADKFCDFLNHYPLEKAQNNFMTFYRDALRYTFECEVDAEPTVDAIPIWFIIEQLSMIAHTYEEECVLRELIYRWKTEQRKEE